MNMRAFNQSNKQDKKVDEEFFLSPMSHEFAGDERRRLILAIVTSDRPPTTRRQPQSSDSVRVLWRKQFHRARGVTEPDDHVADEFFTQALPQRLPIRRAHFDQAVVKRLLAGLNAAFLRGRERDEFVQFSVID